MAIDYRNTNRTLLKLDLAKLMAGRPFTKEDYLEMYDRACKISEQELQCLSDIGLFTDEELEEFDKIVQENINIDSKISRLVKDNPDKTGFDILAML